MVNEVGYLGFVNVELKYYLDKVYGLVWMGHHREEFGSIWSEFLSKQAVLYMIQFHYEEDVKILKSIVS